MAATALEAYDPRRVTGVRGYPAGTMYDEPHKPGRRTGPAPIRAGIRIPRPQARSGTVSRGALRPRSAEPARSSWLLLMAAAVIAATGVAWVLGAPDDRGTASTNVASDAAAAGTTQGPAAGTTEGPPDEPSVGSGSTSTAVPTPDPTERPSPTATSEPTAEPAPTDTARPQPTEEPPIRLVIDAPEDGQVVKTSVIEVVGRAPRDAPITRDIRLWFDDHTAAGPSGFWSMQVALSPGENELRFRIGDDATTARTISVIYAPPG
jgi:hypothetical protein